MESMDLFKGKYIGSMDLYPQQSPEFNRVHPFYDHLKEGRFTTTRCTECGHRAFPPRVICPECLSDKLEWVDLPKEGTVLVVTEEEVGVPLGFETPLIHALVDLDGQLRIFARIVNSAVGQLKEGDRVKLHVFPAPPVPMEKGREVINVQRVYFAFEPA
ncbi:MAG: Zn-ribbon domain-containing OB-fold protein [Thermodesulfobacteriota bacterium]